MLSPAGILAAVAELAPESRALIELSARRGMRDGEIAELLRVDRAKVRRRREAAVEELAHVTGSTATEVRDQLGRLDRADWERRAPAPTEVADTRSRTERAANRSLSATVALGSGLLVIGAVIAVIVITSGGDGSPDDQGAAPASAARSGSQASPGGRPAPKQPGPRVTFRRLNGTYGRGTAQLISEGDSARLRVRVTSLLRPLGGGYALWVLNSPNDARQLLSTRDTTLDRDVLLPPGYARYRYVELSRESTDNPRHSGLSLLRAPLQELAAG